MSLKTPMPLIALRPSPVTSLVPVREQAPAINVPALHAEIRARAEHLAATTITRASGGATIQDPSKFHLLACDFDLSSGKLLAPEAAADSQLCIGVQVYFLANELSFDDTTLEALRVHANGHGETYLPSICQALLGLHNEPYLQNSRLSSPEQNLQTLRCIIDALSNARMSIKGGASMGWLLPPETYAADLTFDESGAISAHSISYTQAQSPRGSHYGGGTFEAAGHVKVLLAGPTILESTPSQYVNEEHQANWEQVLAAQQEARDYYFSRYPFLSDVANGTELGKLYREIAELLERAIGGRRQELTVVIYREEGRLQTMPYHKRYRQNNAFDPDTDPVYYLSFTIALRPRNSRYEIFGQAKSVESVLYSMAPETAVFQDEQVKEVERFLTYLDRVSQSEALIDELIELSTRNS